MTDDVSVKVGVRIRPQIPREIIDMCRVCTMVTPGEPQVTLGSDKSFTYNYVFDMNDTQDTVYEKCVSNLIESALEGYNATVLAYGQTGSGKTYTMGTGFDVELTEDQIGIIPRAIQHIFDGIEEKTKLAKENDDLPPEFTITSQFMELYNEDIIDLFDPIRDGAKNIIKIHEDPHGGIVVSGVETKPVTSIEDAMKCLRVGALSRTTASTQMNSQSSRSHAIFTLLIKQQRLVKVENPTSEEPTNEFETLTAKFHFVDLAGSERLKRTGATGERAKEGISINCGLLALGNVISALGDKSKKALHVPYRDSKLTRLLQDSLGGNSKTLMIACVSPSDRDFMETLNTLKYANRARNIKNRVVINQDKSSRTINLLRQEIAQLQLELLEFKQGKRIIGDDGNESINDMYHENKMLQTELNNLRMRVKGMQETIDALSIKNTELLTEKATGAWMNSETNMDVADMVKAYMREIEELRAKLLESDFMCQNLQKQVNKYQANRSHYHIDSGIDTEDTSSVIVQAKRELKKDIDILHQSMHRDTGTENLDDDNDVDYPNKDIDNDYNDASSSDTDSDEKENYGSELAELTANINMKQKLIEELELSQKRLQTMKQHYEDKLMQLQVRIKDTEHERDKVLSSIGGYNKQPNDKMKKVKDEYERKLCDMQKELKRLQAAKKEHARLLQSQSQHESQLRSLKNDLTEMKRIKVKLINQMKEESARHKQAETKRIQEIAQLRKESRKNANTIRTLETDKRMKEQVLRRKQEELMALRRHNKGHISQISKHTFSAKVAKQKWHSLEKNIHKIVLSKQVMAFQERDMNRLVLRRESLGRDLESLRQRKEALEIQNDDSAIEVDVEIENMMAELNYIQESITESQHHIMQVEDSKENNEGNNIQDVTQSINNVEEAKYLIEKLFNLALTQSYNAAERDLKIQEKETELEHMKQEHNMVNQLLEYMVQKSIEPNITMTTSTSSNGNESDQSSKDSSRSVSPIDSIVQDRSYQEPLKRSKEKDPVVRSKVRKRMAVTRDLLFGTQHEVRDVQSKSQDSESLKQLFANPLVRVPSAPGSLKGLLPLRQNNQSDLLKQSSVVRKLTIPSDRQEPSITSPSMARRPIPSFHSTASLKHESTEQSLGSGSPPGSPSMLRRSLGIREDNVFSRLAASSIEGNIHQQQGAINPYTGKVNTREPLQCISVAEGHNNGVLSVRVTDVSLLTGSIDRTARLWDLTTGIETSILFGHPSNVVAVDCDLSSTIAVTASASVIKVWDLRASPINCVTVLNSSGTSQPGSSYVATRTVQLPIGESQINDVKFNNSGKYIYSASGEKVSVWDLRKFSIVGKLSGGHQAAVMCLSLKEMQNGNDFVVTGSKDHYIKGFNVNPNNVGSLSATMNLEPPHYDGIQSLALGEDVLFSGSRDTCIKKWDLRKEELVQSLNNAHKGWICGLSLMRNNSLLVSGCRTGYIRLWDVTSCEPLANMRAHNSAINAVATNSTHVFTASSCGEVKIWKVALELDN